jgi:hypothetical protein
MRPALVATAGALVALLLLVLVLTDGRPGGGGAGAAPGSGGGTGSIEPPPLPAGSDKCPADAEPVRTSSPWLIKLGQDIPTAKQFASACAVYELRPFDGWVIHARHRVLTATPVPQSDYAADLEDFPSGLVRSTHNFVRSLVTEPLDLGDDAQWETVAGNAGRLAAAMRDSGKQFDGILLDNEWYGSGPSPWDYGDGNSPWSGEPTSPEATADRDQARERGRQVAKSIVSEWPEAVVLALFGPWVSEPATEDALDALGYVDVSGRNELMGTFTYGLAQGMAGSPARFVDGGEVYGARDAEDFAALRAWQRTGLADSGTLVIPPDEREAYQRTVDASVGVYDRDIRADYEVRAPDELGELVGLGLASVDTYLWLYTETHEWGASRSGKPAVPERYLDAVAAARQAP